MSVIQTNSNMPFPIVPVIMGAVSLISNAIAARSSKKQAERTNAANLELSKYQYAEQEKQIDKQNLYNSPASQMARYTDAGLNPNLIYGQGNSGNQASIPQFQAQRQDLHFTPFQIPDMLSGFQDYRMKDAQIDSVKADTELKKTNIGNRLLERLLTQVNTGRKQFDLEQSKILAPYNQDIKHGEAQSAYSKLLQEMQKVDTNKLQQSLMRQSLEKGSTQMKILDQDLMYKQLKNQLFQKGMTPSDNLMLRLLMMNLGNIFGDIDINADTIQRDLKLK